MPLQATSGAASYDAFGGGVAAVPNYIEDVFSTWLYSGTGSALSINNGVDLSGKGGLVWLKNRSFGYDNALFDTARGANQFLSSNLTQAQANSINMLNSFNNNGFTLGTDGYTGGAVNVSGSNYASWTFREQPKFFDVVTYTGTGGGPSSVAHNLGAVPGFVLIKSTSRSGNWVTIARQSNGTYALFTDSTNGLQSTAAANNTSANPGAALTATTFDPSWFNNSNTPGAVQNICDNGVTYVAYLFAHNAGGFGLTGTDNVISCGSYTGTSAQGNEQNLGYEPQWVMVKRVSSDGNWVIQDVMRGMPVSSDSEQLYANTSGATFTGNGIYPTATGFGFRAIGSSMNASGSTYIYIAIRRGPMKTPTTGTSVFSAVQATSNGTSTTWTTTFPVDLALFRQTAVTETGSFNAFDRLRGGSAYGLLTASTSAETSISNATSFDLQTTFKESLGYASSRNLILEAFRRAPGFFDEVCATTDGSGVFTGTHNLGVVPELIITKPRNAVDSWWVYAGSVNRYLLLNSTAAEVTSAGVWGTAPTSTAFTMINGVGVATQVAYLFASCPGVQSIQSYVGDGTTGRTINCGFTGGARFVCIKATSTTGSWWTFDSARGIVTNNDPALQLNSTAAEVTSADAVDTAASGFIVNQEATCSLNASGVTYLVWAIA